MNKKRKTNNNFIVYGISILGISILVGITIGISIFRSEVYWTNYWTVEAAIITALLAVGSIIFELSKHEEERMEKLRKTKEIEIVQETKEKQNILVNHIQEINQDVSGTLLKWEDYLLSLKNEEFNEEKLNKELEQQMVRLLFKYQRFYELFAQFESLKKKISLEFPYANIEEDENNLDPKNQIPLIFDFILNHKNFLFYRNKIESDFPNLANLLNELSPISNYDIKKDSQNTIIKKNILGEWVTNYNRSKQVKYIVGVSIISKRIIAIYKVKKESINTTNDGRVVFNDASLIYEYTEFDDGGAFNELKNWTSRNPVLYYNSWVSDEIKKDDKLKKLIKEKDSPSCELEGINDILVVKTSNFSKKVTSSDIRIKIPQIFKNLNTEELERSELVKEIERCFPYVIDHPGVYQGVFNKINDSKNTFVLQAENPNKRLFNKKLENGKLIYYFSEIN